MLLYAVCSETNNESATHACKLVESPGDVERMVSRHSYDAIEDPTLAAVGLCQDSFTLGANRRLFRAFLPFERL